MGSFEKAVFKDVLSRIDDIFETVNIYKSVLVVPDEAEAGRFACELERREFPVSSVDGLLDFNNDDTRLLILTAEQADNVARADRDGVALGEFGPDLSVVSVVISIGCDPGHFLEMKGLRAVGRFFL